MSLPSRRWKAILVPPCWVQAPGIRPRRRQVRCPGGGGVREFGVGSRGRVPPSSHRSERPPRAQADRHRPRTTPSSRRADMEQPHDATRTAPPGAPPPTRARHLPRRLLPQRQPAQNSPDRTPTTPSPHAVDKRRRRRPTSSRHARPQATKVTTSTRSLKKEHSPRTGGTTTTTTTSRRRTPRQRARTATASDAR